MVVSISMIGLPVALVIDTVAVPFDVGRIRAPVVEARALVVSTSKIGAPVEFFTDNATVLFADGWTTTRPAGPMVSTEVAPSCNVAMLLVASSWRMVSTAAELSFARRLVVVAVNVL